MLMAAPILPISDLDFPLRQNSPLANLWVQAEIADTESRAGRFKEAAAIRVKVLESDWCDGHLRNWLTEELVRDHFCLGEQEQALLWAERLPDSERSIYCGLGEKAPEENDPARHRLFYFALKLTEPKKRREQLANFLKWSFSQGVRKWEVEEARKLGTELARQLGEAYCTICCRTASAKLVLLQQGRGHQCTECLSDSCSALIWSQEPVAPRGINLHRINEMLRIVLKRLDQDQVPTEPRLTLPPLEWSPEAIQCLKDAQSLSPPWTSLDLLRSVKQSLRWSALRGLGGDRPYDPEEPIGADGVHSTGWERAVHIAGYLARWQYRPQPVLPQHLLAGLGWAEEGEASKRLLDGALSLRKKLTGYLRNLTLPLRQIQRLELELQVKPNDIFLRSQLLLAHSWPKVRTRRRCLSEFETHARWILEHRPDHPILLDLHLAPYFDLSPEGHGREIDQKMLFLLEENPDDYQVIRAVAQRWRRTRPRLSRELLRKIRFDRPKIDLELCEISSELGDWAEALDYGRSAAEKLQGSWRQTALQVCFDAQLALQKWDAAEATIKEMAGKEETTVLYGLLAVAKGDVQEAEQQLQGSRWHYRLTRRLLSEVPLEAALEYLESLHQMGRPPIRKGRIRRIREALQSGQPIQYL